MVGTDKRIAHVAEDLVKHWVARYAAMETGLTMKLFATDGRASNSIQFSAFGSFNFSALAAMNAQPNPNISPAAWAGWPARPVSPAKTMACQTTVSQMTYLCKPMRNFGDTRTSFFPHPSFGHVDSFAPAQSARCGLSAPPNSFRRFPNGSSLPSDGRRASPAPVSEGNRPRCSAAQYSRRRCKECTKRRGDSATGLGERLTQDAKPCSNKGLPHPRSFPARLLH